MIAVIADDLTGAAELAGIGVRYGLRTGIRTTTGIAAPLSVPVDLLVIAGDSRSKARKAAVEEMSGITRRLRLLRPEWVYKKTDSVLRGHVVAELSAHLQELGLPLALLVPANPSLGRTIRDLHYYVHDQPVHLTAFATDPEFPVTSSNVHDMLPTRELAVHVRKPTDELPARGIVVGEVRDSNDLQRWAARLPGEALPAGGAEFFTAVLEARGEAAKPPTANPPAAKPPTAKPPTATPAWEPGKPQLFVSGSTFDSSRALIRATFDSGGPVCYMCDDWAAAVTATLRSEGKAVMAIDAAHRGHTARQLRALTADTVAAILQSSTPAELIIEGGSTAYAILEKQGWHSLTPEQELAPGTIRMRVTGTPGLFITVKPGSYRWPESIRY
ncbi:MAG TPA: four-carbon acid sugar kinase family protein [Puia sp.]|nr:four-carbon acid sugar kinase family protein [Puia sp.]